jgi:hypothetical protein
MRKLSAVFLALVVQSSLLFAQSGPNPLAPPETSQFAFMIGTWDCETWMIQPDGSYKKGRAIWDAQWDYDGYAMLDHYSTLDEQGKIILRGIWYCSYDPDSSRWNFCSHSVNGHMRIHSSWKKQENGDMLSYWRRQDSVGRDVLDCVRFTAISDSTF